MKLTLSFNVGRMRKLLRFKAADMNSLALHADLRYPNAIRFVKGHAEQSSGDSAYAAIFIVRAMRHIAQILDTVVLSVAVNVVNLLYRPVSVRVEPHKPMRKVIASVETYPQVARAVRRAGCTPSLCCATETPSVDEPSKDSGFRIIVKKLTQTLRGKIGLSHDAVLSLIGQRPASVSRTARASLFYARGAYGR